MDKNPDKAEKFLDLVVIASPCPVNWDSMVGDERVRHCSGCSKNVYNLSDMTSAEAEEFLEENGSSQCLRLFRRDDGKVMTDNCPRVLRAVRNKCRLALRFVSGLAASIFAFLPFQRVFAQEAPEIRGDVYVPPKSEQKHKEPVPLGGEPTLPNPSASNSKKQILIGGEGCQPDKKGKNNANAPVKPGLPVLGQRLAPSAELSGKPAPLQGSSAMPAPQVPTPQGPAQAAPHYQGFAAPEVLSGTNPSGAKDKDFRDARAQKLFASAQASKASGNKLVAETQFRDAYKAASQQKSGDPNYPPLILKHWNELRKEMGLPLLDQKQIRN